MHVSIGEVSDSCPAFSNYGGCKHIASVLIAYEKHPEWFREMKWISKRFHDLPRERLVKTLEVLFSSVPQARDFIESELYDPSQQGRAYSQKVQEAFGPVRQARVPSNLFASNSIPSLIVPANSIRRRHASLASIFVMKSFRGA